MELQNVIARALVLPRCELRKHVIFAIQFKNGWELDLPDFVYKESCIEETASSAHGKYAAAIFEVLESFCFRLLSWLVWIGVAIFFFRLV